MRRLCQGIHAQKRVSCSFRGARVFQLFQLLKRFVPVRALKRAQSPRALASSTLIASPMTATPIPTT